MDNQFKNITDNGYYLLDWDSNAVGVCEKRSTARVWPFQKTTGHYQQCQAPGIKVEGRKMELTFRPEAPA